MAKKKIEDTNDKITITSKYDPKNNSFTIISIIMSILIIYFHCYCLFYTPFKGDLISRLLIYENTGGVIVAMFFIISGFMITTSIQKSKNIKEYLFKRIKKIIPPLFLCLCISSIIIGPLVSHLGKLEYFTSNLEWLKYIIDNTFLLKNTIYRIQDVFANNTYQYAINGSIWTLKHQFFMYILMIPLFYIFIKSKKEDKFKYFYLILLVLTIQSYTGVYDGIFHFISSKFWIIGILAESKLLLKLMYYFCAGVFINLYADKIKCDKVTVISLIIATLLTVRTPLFPYACLLILPYFTVLLGTLKPKVKIKLIDISYHIYIWGFPIQQLILYCNNSISIYTYIILCIVITLMVSILSYYISEYPFKVKRVK